VDAQAVVAGEGDDPIGGGEVVGEAGAEGALHLLLPLGRELRAVAEDGLGFAFPLTLETKRMEPGSTNRWFLEVYGMDASVRYTTDDPNAFHFLETRGKEQAWCRMDLGYKSMLPTATGPIFQFGFGDAILQMWGAFMSELYGRPVPFGCFTMEETRLSHALATAALRSAETGAMEPVQAS